MINSRKFLAAFAVCSIGLTSTQGATAAESFKVDAVHSSVIFRVKHMNASYAYGRFDVIEGSFALDAAVPSKSTLEVKIKTDSIDTADAKRDQHLKSPDFFNVKQYPSITFKSTKVAKKGEDTYSVTGDLTLHGVTKPVTIELVATGSGKGPMGSVAGVEATFSIKRSDFEMTKFTPMIGDDVRVIVSLEGGHK